MAGHFTRVRPRSAPASGVGARGARTFRHRPAPPRKPILPACPAGSDHSSPRRAGSPAPSRTMTAGSTARSTTVVGAAAHAPASMMRSSTRPSASRIASASLSGSDRAGKDQRRRQDGLAQFREQRLHDGMIRHAHPDRAALRVLQPPRHLARGRQQERESARGALADDPELPVVDLGEMADFRKIPQHEREVVSFVDAADLPDPPGRRRIADVAAERVARVGGIGDHAARAQDGRRLPDETRLGIGGVHLEELSHDRRGEPRVAGTDDGAAL